MIYLFLNCDEYLVAQRVAALKQKLGDPELAGLNTTEMEGGRASVSNVLGQASMMPFLTPQRLLLVSGLISQLDQRMAQSKSPESAAYQDAARLLEGVSQLPETTILALIDSAPDKRRALWRGFTLPATENQPERKVAGLEALIKRQQVSAEALFAPDAKALPGWIQQRAKAQKWQIEGRAVQMLADFVGPNLRQLDGELEKLALYAGPRPISAADVRLLVSDASEALIWDLTDAVGVRNGRKAVTALYELRRGDVNAFQMMSMVARQFRLIIKVKEAMTSGPGDAYAIARQIGEKPYPVKKALSQANNFSAQQLDTILDRLLTADYAMKSGADVETEIDVVLAELTQKQ